MYWASGSKYCISKRFLKNFKRLGCSAGPFLILFKTKNKKYTLSTSDSMVGVKKIK